MVECPACPAGYYCPAGSITPDPCPEGYYCPNGTKFGTQWPCPAGSFSTGTMLEAPDECTRAPAGTYVSASGLTAPDPSVSIR